MFELALRDLVDEIGGELSLGLMPPLAGDATPVGRIVTDSRRIEEGDVFWALAGQRHDGANFVDEAYARGASGVVVQSRRIEPWAGRWALSVADTNKALWQLAAAARYRFAGRVVAVTGSVGKTTTRCMIHQVLKRNLQGSSSPGNFNNQVGLPLSMLEWNPLDDFAVVELGASTIGEIDALAALCQPYVGVITCIGDAHLGGFGSQSAIAEGKGELLAALPDDGWAILGGDDVWLRKLAPRCPCGVLFAGRSADSDILATHVRYHQGELEFTVENCRFRIPVWGRHFLPAALFAIAVGRVFDLPLDDISDALSRFEPVPQRCNVFMQDGITVLDDTYNASPSAMCAALEVLRDVNAPGRRIAVLGDMAELGPDAPVWHARLGEQTVTTCGADLVVACGEHATDIIAGAYEAGLPKSCALALISPDDAGQYVASVVKQGDAVLVKGSRAMRMERVVESMLPKRLARAA